MNETTKEALTAADLALYLGQECETPDGRARINRPDFPDNMVQVMLGMSGPEADAFYSADEVKPLLRPLESMTEEEARELWRKAGGGELPDDSMLTYLDEPWVMEWRDTRFNTILGNSEGWKYLLSKGFDLFDWIPAGLAIDKTKIEINETK